ncbi:MAG: hypothetical protein L0922_01050 [Candidatus Mariimomonas ferrooxydans]
MEVGGTNIKVVHISEEGDILTSLTEPTPASPGASSEDVKNVVIKIFRNILNDNVIGIGFGIAGLIDRKME